MCSGVPSAGESALRRGSARRRREKIALDAKLHRRTRLKGRKSGAKNSKSLFRVRRALARETLLRGRKSGANNGKSVFRARRATARARAGASYASQATRNALEAHSRRTSDALEQIIAQGGRGADGVHFNVEKRWG